jgi:uncharacterized damage-inducible protein DinB
MNLKLHLLARLATERSGLWWALAGLPAEALTAQPITGAWTAKDLLAHVAAWDETFCDWVRMASEDRVGEIAPMDLDAANARICEARREWPLAQAVEVCQAARRRFLALVEPLTWDEMSRSHSMPWGERYSVLHWTQADVMQWRAWHDAEHTKEIHTWRETAGLKRAPGPKIVLRAGLDAGRAELLAWAELVPEEERESRLVCGQWTLRDVLGHMADWEQFSLDCLADEAAGRLAGTSFDGDETEWNRAHAAARQGQSWDAIWTDFTSTRQALLAALDGLADAALAQPSRSRWSDDDRPYWWFWVCLAHDREHAEDLRKALEPSAEGGGTRANPD